MPVTFRYVAAFFVLMACVATQAADYVYRYLDADGKPSYSSLPPPAGTRYERVDVSPSGGPGKGKKSGDTRHDERDRAKHSTANESVPYKEVWREKAGKESVPVAKPPVAPASPGCEGADCKAAAPAK